MPEAGRRWNRVPAQTRVHPGATEGRRGGNEGLGQPLLTPPELVLGRQGNTNAQIPSGEISIFSTHEDGMSKLLSSSSLPCWERWGGGRLLSGLGLGAEARGRASVLCPRAKPQWLSAPPGEPEVPGGSDLVERKRRWFRSPPSTHPARTAIPRPVCPIFSQSAWAPGTATGPSLRQRLLESGAPKPHPPGPSPHQLGVLGK